MYLYLLLAMPAAIACLVGRHISARNLPYVWVPTALTAAVLLPYGSTDYPNYERDYADMASQGLSDLSVVDPMYTILMWACARAGLPIQAFMSILVVLAVALNATAIHRLSRHSTRALLLHTCSYFLIHELTQVRAAIAIGIWMHGIYWYSTDRRRYYMLTLLATCVHIQAALGFLVPAVSAGIQSHRWRWVLVVLLAAIWLAAPTGVFDTQGLNLIARLPDLRTEIYMAMVEEDYWVRPNPFSALSLLATGTAVLQLIRVRLQPPHRLRAEAPIYASLLLGSCALSLFAAIPVAAFRISEHYFALLPVGLALALGTPRNQKLAGAAAWALAIMLLYLFLFHSQYLFNPMTGEKNDA